MKKYKNIEIQIVQNYIENIKRIASRKYKNIKIYEISKSTQQLQKIIQKLDKILPKTDPKNQAKIIVGNNP